MTIDVTKASRETLESVAIDMLKYEDEIDRGGSSPGVYRQSLDKLRAECAAPKLRSREQVNADMAVIIRAWNGAAGGMVYAMPNSSMIRNVHRDFGDSLLELMRCRLVARREAAKAKETEDGA